MREHEAGPRRGTGACERKTRPRDGPGETGGGENAPRRLCPQIQLRGSARPDGLGMPLGHSRTREGASAAPTPQETPRRGAVGLEARAVVLTAWGRPVTGRLAHDVVPRDLCVLCGCALASGTGAMLGDRPGSCLFSFTKTGGPSGGFPARAVCFGHSATAFMFVPEM